MLVGAGCCQAPPLAPLHLPPPFSDLSKKKKFVFSTLNNDFHWGGWDALGARVMIVVEECMGGVVLCVGGSTSDLWEDGKT